MRVDFKKIAVASSLALFLLGGCGNYDYSSVNNVEDGSSEFVSAEVVDDINASVMLSVVKASIDPNAQNAFGYKAVKIRYKTHDEADNEVIASGLLVIPSATDQYQAYRVANGEQPFSVSMICDNHGTIFKDEEAPSNVEKSDGMPNSSLAVMMSGYAGFAVIMPDYIGFGDSKEHYHPYMLKKSSAQASLDMIKASMKYMNDNGIALNYQLFISGYSQGGYTALALTEEIEKGFDTNVNLMGVAPMAGPYLVSAFGDAVLQTDTNMSVPAFMADIANAYSEAYSDIKLEDMIVADKVAAFDGLFDGTKDMVQIQTALQLPLNAPTTMLFQEHFIESYNTDTNNSLKEKFLLNDTGKFNAKSRIKLIHCSNDEVVPVTMTTGVKAYLEAAGSSRVEELLIDSVTADYTQGEAVHTNCAIPAYTQALGWFDAIRKGEI